MRSLFAVPLALALLAGFAGGASARLIAGTDRAETLRGTNAADTILGRGGRDRLVALGGGDLLEGGGGRDVVLAGAGADRVAVEHDGTSDVVSCGAGRDIVTADRRDGVRADCEIVSRAVSRDPYRNADSQHETQVEPDSFGVGSTIVTAFQSGRYQSGGASNIGWATSRDGGRSWRSGFLPQLTRFSRPAGPGERASDPVAAYDAAHGVWLITSLVVAPRTQLTISRSTNGLRWSAPFVAASAPPPGNSIVAYDKQWLACDNWPTSPFRGRCYLTYTDVAARNRISTQTSSDGGQTWSNAVFTARGEATGSFPVIRPNGDLVVVHSDWSAIHAARSTDGGASFAPAVRVAQHPPPQLGPYRALPALSSVDVDRAGTIYATWFDCRFRQGCSGADVVLSSSTDGVTWTQPARVPAVPPRSARVPVTPAIAVDPATSGASARLAIVYYTLSRIPCEACTIETWLLRSDTAGRRWSRPQRLGAQPMRVAWLPQTTLGRMLADYLSVSFSRGRPVPVFSLASRPRGRSFRQAIFATTRLR